MNTMSNWLSIFKQPSPTTDSSAAPPPHSPADGIKKDLADLRGAIAGHLRSAAAFLAPPPPHSSSSNIIEDVAGITEDVLMYIEEDVVSTKSYCWTDFPPLSSPDQGYVLSDVQKKHASVAENMVPDLRNLKYKMSDFMSEEKFWIIYFALLSPILNQPDKELLITPQIEEAIFVLRKLTNKKPPTDDPKLSSEGSKIIIFQENGITDNNSNVKQEVESSGTKLENERPKYIEENISSSDREDSDNFYKFARRRLSEHRRDSSYSDSNEWVKLRESSKSEGGELKAFSGFREKDSEGEDSCGWLTVDEVDL